MVCKETNCLFVILLKKEKEEEDKKSDLRKCKIVAGGEDVFLE